MHLIKHGVRNAMTKWKRGTTMESRITTFQDVYHVIKIHWSDVQGFYGKDDNNNGYVYGIEVNHKDNETECFWFKTEQERDKEYKLWIVE